MRTLIVILLSAFALLRLGGPAACMCTCVDGDRAVGTDARQNLSYRQGLMCRGEGDGSCAACPRCAQATRTVDAGAPRGLDLVPDNHTLPPSAVQAPDAAARWRSDLRDGRPSRLPRGLEQPPPGVAIVRATVRLV
ncbi:MAG: hypothetical protein K2X91_13820 [Thermoleophilia bacterium]|nr:hypothetical protein [Thermoleophilia bacterium]